MKLTKRIIALAIVATMISNNPAILDRWVSSFKVAFASTKGLNLQANSTTPVKGEQSNLVGYTNGAALLWRTCEPVGVLINDGGQESNRLVIVSALKRASEVSGIDFEIKGYTEKVPSYNWYNQGGTPPVIIGVVDASDLLTNKMALGSTVANPIGADIVTGAIALRKSYFETHNQAQKYEVTLHEIGHLIGLKHSNDSSDLMYPSVGSNIKVDFSDSEIKFFQSNKSCERK